MDLLQLEHLLAVAEEGNFTRAAERLCRTQPAVSQSIKKLEEEVGTTLFTRDVHEVALTEAGRLLVDYARRMVGLRDDAVRRLSGIGNLDFGNLTIAAHESAAVYLLPGPVRLFLERFPQIKVGIRRSRLDEIPRQVMDREVDIGFLKEAPAFHELQSVMIHADEMTLIASPRHPLAGRERVCVGDLGSESFVVHHLCSSTEQQILRLFKAHGMRCKIAAELWSFENVKHFVRQDVGLAILPRVCVSEELHDGTLIEVPVEGLDMPRQTFMAFRDQEHLPQPALQFIEIVQQFQWDTARLSFPRPLPAGRSEVVRRAQEVLRPRAHRIAASARRVQRG